MTIYFIAVIDGIAQAQIIQNSLDDLKLNIVKSSHFTDKTETEIKEKIALYFGATMNYSIEYRDHIESTPSGKYRFSISHIDPMEFLC